jgi:hypothetical protein
MARAPPQPKERNSFIHHFPLSIMPTEAITAPAQQQIQPVTDLYDAVFERSANFRIELPFEQAASFIRRVDEYNDFSAPIVLEALEHIDRLMPRKYCGPGNPNNGHRDYSISVGREGSPVIYLTRLEFFESPELEDATMKAICREMGVFGQADEADYHVDEFAFARGRRISFRFWWD